MLRRACAVLALGMMACGGGEPAGPPHQAMSGARAEKVAGQNRPPQVDYVSLSSEPRAGVEVEARFDAVDPDRDPLTFNLTWLRNGAVEQTGPARGWTPSVLEKGDRVELRVVASDGQAESAPAVTSARVGNAAPVVSQVLVEPSVDPKRNEPLVASALTSDADGDEVRLRWEWLVNGKAMRGADGPRLVSKEIQRGDTVMARVVASDGEDESPPVDSAPLTIVNSPPAFERFDGFEPGEGMFRHQFRATDPDGDGGLRFHLAEGPRGMELDPVLGIATWHPGADAKGVIPVTVEVRDAYGASSALRFEITIGGASETAQPAAPVEAASETQPAAQAEAE